MAMNGKTAVLGAGSWGTTLARLLSSKGFSVALWVRDASLCRTITTTRENTAYLPSIKLPDGLKATNDMGEALKGADMVVLAIPSHGLRAVLALKPGHIEKDAIICSAIKGIEESTLLTASGIIKDSLKGDRIVVLSGPSFANEVSRELPTAVSAASDDMNAALAVQRRFSTPCFRVYTNSDVVGVELGGALKNVIAIASGISDGLSLGASARAALITRGLKEITRLGLTLGAKEATFSGLSGLGDLVLTCTGALSRNYTVGFHLGRGKRLEKILKTMRMVAEGVNTAKAAVALGLRQGADMPITNAVYGVLYNGKGPKESVYDLMARDLKGE